MRIAPGFERVGVACVATVVPSLLLVHALASLLHFSPGISPGAFAVSISVIVTGAVHAFVQWRFPRMPAWGWVVSSVVAACAVHVTTGGFAGAVSVGICCAVQGYIQSRISCALPSSIDGLTGRHHWRVAGWSLLAILAVVQTARLATHEADPSEPWWVTSRNPAWAGHLCVSAYVYAADLHEQGETNIYAADYPPADPSAERHPTVENLNGHIDCSFQYPPPFLLLPWGALQLTKDFYVMRPVWLAFIGLGYLALSVVLCLGVGGARGRLALWLLPAVWVAVPTLQTHQFGQIQMLVFALALAGMFALGTRRTVLGGALLGVAVVTKIYPAVLLLLLGAERRWRDLGVTVIWMVVFAALGFALLGPAPYHAFLTYQLRGLLDGSAFDYSSMEPVGQDTMTAIIVSVSTIPGRLGLLGVPHLPDELGPWLGRLLALVILGLIWRASRWTTGRANSVVLWIALLNLVVLQGPVAFVDYTTATSLWLLTFVGLEMGRNRVLAFGGWICWLLVGTLFGTWPIPDDPTGVWPDVAISPAQIAASTLTMTLLLIPLNIWCAMSRFHDHPE